MHEFFSKSVDFIKSIDSPKNNKKNKNRIKIITILM